MTTTPIVSPESTSSPMPESPTADAVIIIDSRSGTRTADDPIEFLVLVMFDIGITVRPLRLVRTTPNRLAIAWPEPVVLRDAGGVEHAVVLSANRKGLHTSEFC